VADPAEIINIDATPTRRGVQFYARIAVKVSRIA
jgi:hypothetical protein